MLLPTPNATAPRIIKFAKEYASKGVQVVAINPNNPDGVSVDELGYTSYSDSFGASADTRSEARQRTKYDLRRLNHSAKSAAAIVPMIAPIARLIWVVLEAVEALSVPLASLLAQGVTH